MSFLGVLAAVGLCIWRLYAEPRFNIPSNTGSLEAVAHLFVGGAFVAWLQSKWAAIVIDDLAYRHNTLHRDGRWLFAWLAPTAFELLMFLLQKP